MSKMIKIKLRDHWDTKGSGIDLAGIKSSAAAAGRPLGELVDDMELLEKTLLDTTSHERGINVLLERLNEGYDIDLFLGHQKDVDPKICERLGYTSSWVNSRFTIAFRKPENQPILFAVIDMNVLFADKIYVPSLLREELNKLGATGWPENVKITPEQVYGQFQEMALGTDYVRMAKEGQWIALVIGDTDAFLKSKHPSLFTNQKFGGPGWTLVGSKVPNNTFHHHPFDQFTPGMDQQHHPQDQWEHVNNDMLVELLNHYALTQVVMLPENAPRNSLPQGMDLLKLVQLRLGADRMHRGMPGFNQMQNRGYSYGQPVFNQPMFRNQPIWGNGNAFFTEQMAPQASNGRYTRQPFTGAWVWYPSTPLFVVLDVDRTDDKPQEALKKLLQKISENMYRYGEAGETHIPDMLKEMQATLENHPRTTSLLLNNQVTLFVGERGLILPAVSNKTDNCFTNWVLVDGAWNPQKEYNPHIVINTIEGIATLIPGYMDRFNERPNMY